MWIIVTPLYKVIWVPLARNCFIRAFLRFRHYQCCCYGNTAGTKYMHLLYYYVLPPNPGHLGIMVLKSALWNENPLYWINPLWFFIITISHCFTVVVTVDGLLCIYKYDKKAILMFRFCGRKNAVRVFLALNAEIGRNHTFPDSVMNELWIYYTFLGNCFYHGWGWKGSSSYLWSIYKKRVIVLLPRSCK